MLTAIRGKGKSFLEFKVDKHSRLVLRRAFFKHVSAFISSGTVSMLNSSGDSQFPVIEFEKQLTEKVNCFSDKCN
jgi:hypothetical protein